MLPDQIFPEILSPLSPNIGAGAGSQEVRGHKRLQCRPKQLAQRGGEDGDDDVHVVTKRSWLNEEARMMMQF